MVLAKPSHTPCCPCVVEVPSSGCVYDVLLAVTRTNFDDEFSLTSRHHLISSHALLSLRGYAVEVPSTGCMYDVLALARTNLMMKFHSPHTTISFRHTPCCRCVGMWWRCPALAACTTSCWPSHAPPTFLYTSRPLASLLPSPKRLQQRQRQ
jgi:hypothetical protein